MVDLKKLENAIRQFEFYSRPSSSNGNSPATVDDINNLIRGTANLMRSFLSEIEDK